MRISVSSDMDEGIAPALVAELGRRGHSVVPHGALHPGERSGWAYSAEAAARDVAEGRADQAVVCCWTGTGASIAANKVPGVRAALCADAVTAAGARRWNDANVLALSLRLTSAALLGEILDAWFTARPSEEPEDRENIGHVDRIGTSPVDPEPAPRWLVMRQDDNGNRFPVSRFADRAEAQACADEFEARGHKQLYWVAEEEL